jgi:hypothetical protein
MESLAQSIAENIDGALKQSLDDLADQCDAPRKDGRA